MADPYFSEIKYLGGPTLDFIEVVVDAGADVSELVVTIYLPNGTIRSSNPIDGLTPTTVGGKDVYIIDSSTPTFTGLAKNNAISLSDDTGVYAFYSFDDTAGTVTAAPGTPAFGEGPSTDIGIAGAGESLETTDGGTTYVVQTTPNPGSIPCLTAGTLIKTELGDVPVEQLEPGSRVLTLDGEYARVARIFQRTIDLQALTANPNLLPIRISAGALGNGLPRRDLLVSRQHRMLAASPIVRRMFGKQEVLIAAILLTELPGIYVDDHVTEVTYFHVAFDTHQVIFAEGAPTESLLLNTEAVKSLPEPLIEELEAIFPDLRTKPETAGARHIPDRKKQKEICVRHAKNARALLSSFQADEHPACMQGDLPCCAEIST